MFYGILFTFLKKSHWETFQNWVMGTGNFKIYCQNCHIRDRDFDHGQS